MTHFVSQWPRGWATALGKAKWSGTACGRRLGGRRFALALAAKQWGLRGGVVGTCATPPGPPLPPSPPEGQCPPSGEGGGGASWPPGPPSPQPPHPPPALPGPQMSAAQIMAALTLSCVRVGGGAVLRRSGSAPGGTTHGSGLSEGNGLHCRSTDNANTCLWGWESGTGVPLLHRRCLCPSASLPRRRRRCLTLSHPQDREVRRVPATTSDGGKCTTGPEGSGVRGRGASIGQVWTRHLAPAAPASRPSSPSQFHDCPCHADSALQFVPSLVPGWGKSRAASTGFRALSPSD